MNTDIKLSILIPTLESRKKWYERINFALYWQIAELKDTTQVEIIKYEDKGEATIGEKRNILVEQSRGKAISFVDCDDFIGDQYIQRGLDFVDSGMDAASLIGLYFSNGVYDRPFLHSSRYTHWWQDDKFYYRTNNHLNFLKSEIAKQITFPHQNFGEDGQHSEKLKASGLIKTEFEIKETLYFYFARSKKENE